MGKENLKRKGIDDGGDNSGAEDDGRDSVSPAADGAAASSGEELNATTESAADTSGNGDGNKDEGQVEQDSANDDTAEENGDTKEDGAGSDEGDTFEDAESGDKADKGNGEGGADGGEENGSVEGEGDKKVSRGRGKPPKKAISAQEANGDGDDADKQKENGGGKTKDDGDGDEDAEGEEEDAGDEDKNDADSDYDGKPKKPKKAPVKRKPAKKQEKEEEYEVQDIIDHRKEKGKVVYRIRWKNYGARDDTWEPESTLSCPEIIRKYKARCAENDAKRTPKKTPAKKGGKGTPGRKPAKKEDKEEEYEVQDIIDHQKEKGGKVTYRIRWKNYGPRDDTWEEENTLNCPEIIRKYWARCGDDEEEEPPAKKGKPTPKKGPAGKKAAPAPAGRGRGRPSAGKKPAYNDDSDDEEDDSEEESEYEVERILDVHYKRNGDREYLVRWKGFTAKDDTWEPEDNLNCKDLISKFNEKLDKTKSSSVKELRVNRKHTARLTLVERGRKTSRRNANKGRVNYYDGE